MHPLSWAAEIELKVSTVVAVIRKNECFKMFTLPQETATMVYLLFVFYFF